MRSAQLGASRFTAIVRAFVPLLAGVLRMSTPHFYAANILSALVWAPLHIYPGVLLAMAVSFAGETAEHLIPAAPRWAGSCINRVGLKKIPTPRAGIQRTLKTRP